MTHPALLLSLAPAMLWRFTETSGAVVGDASGNARTGNVTGGYTRNVASLLNDDDPALRLSGADSMVTSDASNQAWQNAPSWTAILWSTISSVANDPVLYCHDNNGTTSSFRWRAYVSSTGNLSCVMLNNAAAIRVYNAGPLPQPGNRHQIALTYDDATDTMQFYVDGQPHGAPYVIDGGGLKSSCTAPLRVGAIQNTPPVSELTGDVDEFAWFTSALTPAQIEAVYDDAVGGGTVGDALTAKVAAAVARIRDEINAVRSEIPSGVGLTAEDVRDLIGSTLVQGSNITVTPNDAADTVEIAATVPASGLTLEQVQDAVAAMLVEGTGVDLAYDDSAGTLTVTVTGSTGGGATTLAALTDVDDIAPTVGQALVWDGDSWKPTTLTQGGPEVGAWENNQQTAFTYPAVVEVDKQPAPIVLPNGRTLTPQIELTVTADMLVGNTGADIGHETGIFLMLSTLVTTISGTGNVFTEAAVVRAATGTETVYSSNQISSPGTANTRSASSIYIPHVKVGDKVRLRQWAGTNAPNMRIDWYAYRSVVSKLGNKVDAGRVGLFRDLVPTGAVGTHAPATILAAGPTNWVANGAEPSRQQWLDNGVIIGQNQAPGQTRTLLADPSPSALGILTTGDSIAGTGTVQSSAFTTSAGVNGLPNLLTQLRFDRVFVPVPPT